MSPQAKRIAVGHNASARSNESPMLSFTLFDPLAVFDNARPNISSLWLGMVAGFALCVLITLLPPDLVSSL